MTDAPTPPPIRVRWVRRLKAPDPKTGLALEIVDGEVRASMLSSALDPVSAARVRESDCRREARRYRESSFRTWSYAFPEVDSTEYLRLTEEAKKRYVKALAMVKVAQVWDEQAAAWSDLRQQLEARAQGAEEQ